MEGGEFYWSDLHRVWRACKLPFRPRMELNKCRFFPPGSHQLAAADRWKKSKRALFIFNIFDTRAEKVTLSRWEGLRCLRALLIMKFKSF